MQGKVFSIGGPQTYIDFRRGLGRYFRTWRLQQGIDIRDMAQALGAPLHYLTSFEAGGPPPLTSSDVTAINNEWWPNIGESEPKADAS